MTHKLISAAGFVLVILGIGCVDSPSLLAPIMMIIVGAALVVVSAEWEERWTEE